MNSKKNKEEINKLILAVRGGDQAAFIELLKQYSPLIEASVNMFCSDGLSANDKDDFRQEASVAFYNSVLTYDLEQSDVELGLYAKICVCNALISQIRIAKRIPTEVQELSDNIVSNEAHEDLSSRLLEEERLSFLFKIIRNTLSKYEYRVWELYLSGCSTSEIARQLNTDSKSISNAIYRIRVKLKETLNKNRND
ncbi:MAG: sigma-70 family RNA polymerase sigma factor [Ruminococcaceae bacterium]|nr:sigma-70 family RNA polymerase sigma factor [Oscillospiraceae bacterium]